ncbi:hypothetical protein O1M54_47995 [Streptomyces diastatochromogenes]|nr:hypothetical protein [Streptomyces diastatochromogenes]
MAESSDPRRATAPEPEPGRPLSAGVALLATAVAVINLLVGGTLTTVALTGHVLGAWSSPDPLSPGLIGAGMLGAAPALFGLARTRTWEQARTLVLPLTVVLAGLFAVSLLNAGRLYIARGGPIVSVLFSLGWLFVLGLLCVGRRSASPGNSSAGPGRRSRAPLRCPAGRSRPSPCSARPGWASEPGCCSAPASGRTSCPGTRTGWTPKPSASGPSRSGWACWAPHRGRPGPHPPRPAVPARHGPRHDARPGGPCPHVDWSSGPGLGLVAMVAGLLAAGASGRLLLRGGAGPGEAMRGAG